MVSFGFCHKEFIVAGVPGRWFVHVGELYHRRDELSSVLTTGMIIVITIITLCVCLLVACLTGL